MCLQVEMAAKIQFRATQLGTIYALPEEAEEMEKDMYEAMHDFD